jgi:hypothetical protein
MAEACNNVCYAASISHYVVESSLPSCAGTLHNCRRNGEPFTDKSLYKLFWTTAYRLTGKRTNPHLVRDSIVTYLRGGDATERELEVRRAPWQACGACMSVNVCNAWRWNT